MIYAGLFVRGVGFRVIGGGGEGVKFAVIVFAFCNLRALVDASIFKIHRSLLVNNQNVSQSCHLKEYSPSIYLCPSL